MDANSIRQVEPELCFFKSLGRKIETAVELQRFPTRLCIVENQRSRWSY